MLATKKDLKEAISRSPAHDHTVVRVQHGWLCADRIRLAKGVIYARKDYARSPYSTIRLEDDTAAALDRMIADVNEPGTTPEIAAAAALSNRRC